MSRFVVGVTGGVASGKSELTQRFERLGIVVADADLVSRQLVQPGEPLLMRIVDEFGDNILNTEGALDRRRLRERIFGDDNARRQLEALLHPSIRAALQNACAAAESAYAMAVVPLLTEGGGRASYPWLDRILVLDTPLELQQQRLMHRDDIAPALARQMIAAQAIREQRLAIADDVVVNDGDLTHLDAAVTALDARYRALAGLRG